MNNPVEAIKGMLSSMNPQQVVMYLIGNNTNPIVKNLIQMAQNGNTKEIEEFARNMYKEQGKDFDQEFSNFMNMFKK